MEVEIKKIDGLKLKGKDDSGHEIIIDTKKEFGGHDSAPTPVNLFLLSLGSCTLMDVISLIDKMKVDYDDIKVKVSGERHDKHPKTFKDIQIKYIIHGKDPDESKIKKAIDLSTEKYCSIHAMIKKSTNISNTFEIIKKRIEPEAQ
jgi:putative redox protein